MSAPSHPDELFNVAPSVARIRLAEHPTVSGVLVIAALTLLVYLPSLHGTFLIDDDRYVTQNPLLAAPDGLYRIWFSSEPIDYWPLTYTTFWFEWRLWGMNPFGYHLVNVALHVATTLLLWMILRKLSIPGAFLAALIFAVHPVNVESVAWISQRKAALASFFLMLSILWYLRDEEAQPISPISGTSPPLPHRWYWFSLLAFLAAGLSLISVVSMPLVLLLIAWWQRGRIAKRDVLRTIPFFVVALVLILIQLTFLKHGDPVANPAWDERIAGAGAAVWFYLAKALLPIKQSFFYPQWEIATHDLLWWLPTIAVLALTLILIRQRSGPKSPGVRSSLFAWAYFCLAIGPALGFLQSGSMAYSLVADRYEHLAVIGVAALSAAAWSYWRACAAPSRRWPAAALAIILVTALGSLTWQRSRLFGNPIELYQSTLARNSDARPSVLFHTHLGDLYLSSGQLEQSIAEYERALRLNPDVAEAHHNLANALMAARQPQAAIAHYEQAIKLRPDYVKSHCNLGNALLSIGQTQQAIEHFQQAVQIDPNCAQAHNDLGSLLLNSGRLREATEHFQLALNSDPDSSKAHNNLAIALASTGRIPESIPHFQKSLELEPNKGDTHFNLGVALLSVDRVQDAANQFAEAVRLQPNRLSAYAKLSAAYAQLQQSENAIDTAEKGLQIARATGQTETAAKIEDWLSKYRASLQDQSGRPASPAPPARLP